MRTLVLREYRQQTASLMHCKADSPEPCACRQRQPVAAHGGGAAGGLAGVPRQHRGVRGRAAALRRGPAGGVWRAPTAGARPRWPWPACPPCRRVHAPTPQDAGHMRTGLCASFVCLSAELSPMPLCHHSDITVCRSAARTRCWTLVVSNMTIPVCFLPYKVNAAHLAGGPGGPAACGAWLTSDQWDTLLHKACAARLRRWAWWTCCARSMA